MAVFRVAKSKGYTVMSNYHLNDKSLTLKAKGLLSQMLSLPDTWDFTLRGLAHINKESIDAIRTAVLELEQNGYTTRQQGRDAGGKLTTIEYTIYEQPQQSPPCLDNPITVEPCLDYPYTVKPYTDKPTSENPMQLNTYVSSNQEEITDTAITHQSIHQEPERAIDRIDTIETHREIIYENISYDILCERHGIERVDEAVELILETLAAQRENIRIAGDEFPAAVVKSRLMKLDASHVEYVFGCLDENTTKIRNIKSYLLTALYNAPATMDSYYRAEVNHDMYGGDSP